MLGIHKPALYHTLYDSVVTAIFSFPLSTLFVKLGPGATEAYTQPAPSRLPVRERSSEGHPRLSEHCTDVLDTQVKLRT
jgi:hypothetical protein